MDDGMKKECFATEVTSRGEFIPIEHREMHEREEELKDCGVPEPKAQMDFDKNEFCIEYDDVVKGEKIDCPTEVKRHIGVKPRGGKIIVTKV